MDEALKALEAEVATCVTVEQSAIALIGGLAAQVQALPGATDSAEIRALVEKIKASETSLAAAVSANTPAAPAAPAV